MRCPLPFVFSALAVVLCLPARGLEWKSMVFEATAKPFQETVDAVFEFTNAGTKPVTILGLDSGCECVAVSGERTAHGPGAIGHINATFTVGDRVGEYERAIYVRTDEDPDKPVRLLLRITVPELAEIAPRLVFWQKGRPADERIIEIKIVAAVDLHLDAVQAMTDVFAVRLEPVVAGKHYRLHVKPRDTAQPISDALRIRGATADGRPLILSAYAYVK